MYVITIIHSKTNMRECEVLYLNYRVRCFNNEESLFLIEVTGV
ncbi:hypothetical protein BAOM_4289 [Peribacillus asahii]|uniref:Uncharacterized protein n=1 Tax=Peribacillus asahii TaxID=228899 RepID=A0A3Q9RQH9_9BACI|nr:hypothetical protein BAOM_4289 [Peribacillus asahii]